MTAEEIVNKYPELESFLLSPERHSVIEAMKEYASIKCREQREICYKEWINFRGEVKEEGEAIINAPEPKFD